MALVLEGRISSWFYQNTWHRVPVLANVTDPRRIPSWWTQLIKWNKVWTNHLERSIHDSEELCIPKDYRIFSEPGWADQWYKDRKEQSQRSTSS